MKVQRQVLLSRLESVEPGLASRELVQQSSCFVFKGGRIYTFNDEVACSIKSNLDIEGAVPAKPLKELLSKLTEEELDIEAEDGKLRIKGVGRRAEIAMETEIGLPIESIEEPGDWSPLTDDFIEGIRIVHEVAAKTSDDDFTLTCVHLHPKYVEACDNFQACRYGVSSSVKQSRLIKKNSARHIHALGVNEVSETDGWIHFKNPMGLLLSVRCWSDSYADIDRLFEGRGNPVTLPGGLAESVEKAKIFSSESTGSDDILVSLKEDVMTIKGEGVHGRFEERKKVNFKESIAFMIAPVLLIEVAKKANECFISPNILRIDSGNFVYISSLEAVE